MEKLHILYIEDYLPDLEFMKYMYFHKRPDAVRLTHAGTLAEGIRVAESEKIDVILCDLSLPDSNGFEGLLKIIEKIPFTPIVVLTGNNAEDQAMHSLKLGAQDYLVKGEFTQEMLHRVIKHAYERGQILNEVRTTQEALRKAIGAAEMASHAKSQFLASMSHEIRTPLNTILGIGDLLSETALTDQQKRYVDIFQKSGNHLLELINTVLDLSKIEAGEFSFSNKPFDLNSCLENISEWACLSCQLKKLTFYFDIDLKVRPKVIGDAKCIRQILVNLIGNAIKFTERGNVSFYVSVISETPGSQVIRFKILDTGIGVPEEKRKSIFEEFTQADQSITRKYGGTGLGLSISKKFVDRMNGKIELKDEKGWGAVFEIDIPITSESSETLLDRKGNFDLNGQEVIIVSDHVKFSLKKYLEELGGKVVLLTPSDETYSRLYQLNGDTAYCFLDCASIDDAGKKKLRTIMKERNLKDIVIPVLSPEQTIKDLSKSLGYDCLRYLVKPIRWMQLLDEVCFPYHKKESPLKGQKQNTPNDSNERRVRLLVAEDIDDNRFLLSNYFKDTQCDLDFAENGLVAYEKFVNGAYDLAFMDLQMPVMDGYTAAKKIRDWERQLNRKNRTPIIALTAHVLEKGTDRIKDCEFTDFLTKPIRKVDLIEVVKKYKEERDAAGS